MIQANELRVGNWVNWNGENGVVSQILEHEVVFKCGEDTLISELKGIPLTDKDVKQYGHFNLIKVNEEYFVCFGNYKTQIKFYHELQNYYYLVNHDEL